jgi:hypothetical protein
MYRCHMNKFAVKAVFKTNDPDALVSRLIDAIKVVVARTSANTLIELSGVDGDIQKGQVVVTIDAATLLYDIRVKDVKQHVEALLERVMCLPEDMNPAREDLMVEFVGTVVKKAA